MIKEFQMTEEPTMVAEFELKVGGNDEITDEVKGQVVDLKTRLGQSWSGSGYNPYPLSSYSIRIPIDDNNCIDAYRVYGKTQGLIIVNVELDNGILRVSTPATIDLNLGENTTTAILTTKNVKVAEDKSFVIFGCSGVNKFFYVPLNKDGQTYSFGTPISLDLDTYVSDLVIMDNNTFVIHQFTTPHKLLVIKLSNGTLSVERTINEQQINSMDKVEDKLVITSDMRLAVYNVSTGERIYRGTSGAIYRFNVVKNKAITFERGIGIEIDGDNVSEFVCEKDFVVSPIKYYILDSLAGDVYIFIYSYSESNKELKAFTYNYKTNKMEDNVKIMNNLIIPNYDYAVLVHLVDSLLLGYTSGSDAYIYQSDIIKNKIISLKYKNNTYEISEVGQQ